MICPKCKAEIEDKSIVCNECGAKIGGLCKDCGAYNLINAEKCSVCGKELLKICTECGAANLPYADKCRKCGIDFKQSDKEDRTVSLQNYNKMSSQQKAKSRFLEGINNPDCKIITLSGVSGCGKNLVLRSAINELKESKLIWLMGTCTQTTQLSPFGYFQDLLLTFFNINNYCPDTLQLKRNSIKFFRQDFPTLSNDEVIDLLNLLYPEVQDKYENIYYNKTHMFSIMKKVLFTIVEKMKVVFIVDKFEYIDGMSFDFIKELLQEDIILNRTKFVLLCTEQKPGLGLLTANSLKEENYLDITIAPFTDTQSEEFLKQYNDGSFGKDFVNLALKVSKGNPAIIEQLIFLKKDSVRNNIKEMQYNTVESVVKNRLAILKKEDIKAYRILVAMSVLGIKFYPSILETFDNNSPQEFDRIIQTLSLEAYISQINNLSFEFKSNEIWHEIVNVVKNDDSFEEILNRLYEIISSYKQSSMALVGYIVQKLNNSNQSFDIWTLLMKHAAYIGDIGLYIIAQKQSLKLIENKNSEFYLKVKKNIYTRVGKLLEPIDPKASFEYLQQAVMMIEDWEDPLHIELLGYIASCSMKLGNYFGAIECIENVLNKLPENMKFEKTLVQSRLVTPLLRLGNYGQIVNSVETELLPDLEKVLSKGKDTSVIKVKDLFELWVGVYFDFAEALVFQGDNRSFDVIQTIYEILERNSSASPELIHRANLLLALANTIKGNIADSTKILEDMLKDNTAEDMDDFIVSRWNFIDILNKFFTKDYLTLHTELFNVAAYANNVNDNFTKNILKTLLAKILKENNQTKKALEILEEQVAYFAKEKVATGVLLSWYLIAEIKLITNGTQFALDIATKALDIAQGPNINNYYFIALFNKLIGEIYVAKQDFDSAKVYLEKALFIAKQFDMQYVMVKTYIQCAKLYQELALPKSNSRGTYIKQALKMFQAAKNVPIASEQSALLKDIKENLNILTSFCKLNGIILRREK